MKTYGAVGIGIGKRDLTATGHVLVIYLPSAATAAKQVESVEGIPLKFEVTGDFRPL